MMDGLWLYIPHITDSWFYVKMMAYNATWFPPNGCILEPKEKWQSLYENWIGKEPE